MARVRREINSLGTEWNETVLWYARGVQAMQARPVDDPKSWAFQAGMHGYDKTLWARGGYPKAGEQLPAPPVIKKYWFQCQHQSWYFLPWHRAYILAFEKLLLAEIVKKGGPADWALPYWNYSKDTKPETLRIPKAFLDTAWPDGADNNPLHVALRFGKSVLASSADLKGRLDDHDFEGVDGSVQVGVGGPNTPFSHSGEYEGLIEAQPHDLIHGDIGGNGGLMSRPESAGLDPIFWIHHANIDRLWEVWRHRDARNVDPASDDWKKGPADIGFAFVGTDASPVPSIPEAVADLATLGYSYDDVSDPFPGRTRRQTRLHEFDLVLEDLPELGENEVKRSGEEILGASDGSLKIGIEPAESTVRLAKPPLDRLSESFTIANMRHASPGEPDRVFLKIEGIRGDNGAASFDVSVKPQGASADQAVDVGQFSLFGLERASNPEGRHGGVGLTKVIEITHAIDGLKIATGDVGEALDVGIHPRSNVTGDDSIHVAQISVVRVPG